MHFQSGASAQDVVAALGALSGRLAADTPVLALGGPHAAGAAGAAFASTSIMQLFGATTLAALRAALAKARAPGAAHALRRLAETVPADGPARLETLHFQLAGVEHAVNFLCRKVAVAGGPPLFVAAALDLPAALSAAAGASPAAATWGPTPAAARFLWRTGADHRIADVDASQVQPGAGADLVGAGLVDIVARSDRAAAAELARLLERRESFAGVEIVWPLAGSTGVAATIAGTPAVDDQRRFAGFRGFGLIRREHLAAAREAAEEAAKLEAAKESAKLPPAPQSPTPQSPTPSRRRPDPAAGRQLELALSGIDAELRQSQREARELHAILDTAMDGVAVLDAQGRLVALNRSGEALFGFDKAEVAGEPFTILLAPESRERAKAYFDGLRSHGVASLLNDGREVQGLTRQGGAIPLFMTLGRIGDAGAADRGARYCALLRDMSHWKKVERELDEARREAERASALKSDFLAKVSHEIRTPLNAILGFAEVIMEERFGPIGNARYKEYLKDIHSSGALVLSLVNDLLDLSKIEAGKLDLALEAVDANRIVTECVSIMQPQATAAHVVTRLSLAPQLPHVWADERSLRQIVLNLLSNAIKFTQGGGQVIISTALTETNHAALRIRDTGVGMSADEIEVALEPFRQIASARASGGTGLGLPLTKALADANHASFSIKSKVDEGTLVEVVFAPARVVANRS